jgi:hypothetical protein
MFQQGYYGNGGFPAYGYGSSAPRYGTPQSGIQFVEGQKGAEAYYLAPSTNALLMDSTGQRFFIKTADANGICSMRSYDFVEHVEEAPKPPIDTSNFITREEFKEAIEALKTAQNAPKTASLL